jgi:hypothetical protein
MSGLLKPVLKRWRWIRYDRTLSELTTLDEFHTLMAKLKDPAFSVYERWDTYARRDLAYFLDAVSINLEGARFLDVGPGYGSALDVARERGAISAEFVDYDPFVFAFNRLKGHVGTRLDVRRELANLAPRQYELVWLKATFNADRFIRRQRRGWQSPLDHYPDLERLILDVDKLIAPGGAAVFCPHWASSNGNRSIQNVLDTSVATILERHEYRALPPITGHNFEPMYPITFMKTLKGRRGEALHTRARVSVQSR